MGWGQWAIVAQRLGATSFGYDLSGARRRFAREHGVETVEDVAEIQPASLDFINTEQVLEHVDAPLALVHTLRAKLRPGGILKIAVPRSRSIAAEVTQLTWREPDLGRRINAVHPLEHVNCFSPTSIAAMASRAGLATARIRTRDYLAFTLQHGATPTRPRAVAKALARPLYHRFSRTNLYVWLRAAS
jgi:2-polyprenyl-3-methyl-5-hydroxy-6-metoxy-1,4-benzoquinol methylase